MVDLDSALSIATSGMNGIDSQYSVLSNNISNAHVPGYVNQTDTILSDVPAGERNGVRPGHAFLDVSDSLQNALYHENANVAGYNEISNSLSVISAIQGKTDAQAGQTGTLPDQLGNLKNSFVQLTSHPLDSSAQEDVIQRAQDLTGTIHQLSGAYQTQRQGAENRIKQTVSDLNNGLTQIGVVSNQIMKTKALGGDTSNLEEKRLEIMHSIAPDLDLSYTENGRGDMFVHTRDGTLLPTRPDQINEANDSVQRPTGSWPLSATAGKPAEQVDTNITPYSFYTATKGGNIPGIHVARNGAPTGADITQHLTGGIIGANLKLRDQIYPKMQAQLDSFSEALIRRFHNAGVSLFKNQNMEPLSTTQTDQNGHKVKVFHNHPPQSLLPNQKHNWERPDTMGGYVNLSSSIVVSNDYAQNPQLLVPQSDLSRKPGQLTHVQKVLEDTFGTSNDDVGWPSRPHSKPDGNQAPSTHLGPNGQLSTGYPGTQSLTDLASSLTSYQGDVLNDNNSQLSFSTAIQTNVGKKVASTSGVNINDEMSRIVGLQNAFVANAKVVSMVQTMFSSLLNAVQ